MDTEIQKIIECCQKNLDLTDAKLSDEYYYNSLPLCVIDAVFSIGVNYSSTRNVVIKYCDYFNLKRIRKNKKIMLPIEEQESIINFCEKFNRLGLSFFVNNIFVNKQMTSVRSGILKAQAVYEFCQILKRFDVNYLQDVGKVILNKKFEEEIRKIKGQKSGISLRYFFMLSGSDDFIKPDRMILRFLENTLERNVTLSEAQKLLEEVSHKLSKNYPSISPRLLDHQIWNFQSGRV